MMMFWQDFRSEKRQFPGLLECGKALLKDMTVTFGAQLATRKRMRNRDLFIFFSRTFPVSRNASFFLELGTTGQSVAQSERPLSKPYSQLLANIEKGLVSWLVGNDFVRAHWQMTH